MTIPRLPGIIPHCETVLHNHDCPYIVRGCTGCFLKPLPIDDTLIKFLSGMAAARKNMIKSMSSPEINAAANRTAESMRMLARQMNKIYDAWYASLPEETRKLIEREKS